MTKHSNIASEFEQTGEQITQQILNDYGDAITFYAMAMQRIADGKVSAGYIRSYARRTIIGANSILNNG